MAIINELSGKELEASNFIVECMYKFNIEADNADLMNITLNYLQSFIETFEPSEINPVLSRAQKIYKAQINSQLNNLATIKQKNNDDFNNGVRTNDIVQKELPKWPSCFKNPHKISQLFGNVSTGKKSKKCISAISSNKLILKIKGMKTETDILYLVEYFIKFFFGEKEKNYYQEYDLFLNKLLELKFQPKTRNICFQQKDNYHIFCDIVSLFLEEDLTVSENKKFLEDCIERYHVLFD